MRIKKEHISNLLDTFIDCSSDMGQKVTLAILYRGGHKVEIKDILVKDIPFKLEELKGGLKLKAFHAIGDDIEISVDKKAIKMFHDTKKSLFHFVQDLAKGNITKNFDFVSTFLDNLFKEYEVENMYTINVYLSFFGIWYQDFVAQYCNLLYKREMEG